MGHSLHGFICLTFQIPTFASWGPKPLATFVDAFTLDWGKFDLCYIFPPFSPLTRCLQKNKSESKINFGGSPVASPTVGCNLKQDDKGLDDGTLCEKQLGELWQPKGRRDAGVSFDSCAMLIEKALRKNLSSQAINDIYCCGTQD